MPRLPEDKTLLMHVAAMCEGLLALARDQEFAQAMGRYRNLMETADGRYWLPGFYLRENLVPRLCQLADLMRCEDSGQAMALFRKLSERPRQPILQAAAVRHLTRRLGLVKRLAVSLDIWARQFVNLSR